MRSVLISIVLLLFISPTVVHAQVIISEIYPAPVSGESEWIELVNLSSQAHDISGWQVWDQLASPSLLHTFPEDTIIAAEIFVIITLATQKLNNSGDAVTILNSEGVKQDELSYASSTSGTSWQRVTLNDTQLVLTEPTPLQDNPSYPLLTSSSTPSPTSVPQTITSVAEHVTLTEFSACPAGGNEWIELYNTADAITLNNWVIRDEVGNQRKISGILPSHSFTRFEWSGAILRNTGDSFVVVTDTGEQIGAAIYESCQTGSSHVFDGTRWIQIVPDEIQQHLLLPSPSPTSTSPAPTVFPTPQFQTEIPSVELATPTAAVATPPLQLPTFSPYKPENLVSNAIKRKTVLSMTEPSIPYISLLSVILGGLLVFIPGVITLYVNRRRSPPIQ